MYPREPVARILPDVLTDEDFPVHFGRYTLLGVLGEGGMARVFKAELAGLEGFKKKAAVKIVRSSIASDNQRLRTSLINEARLGGLLHHPNIVDTYEFGEVDGLPFIAMEYVRGIGLEQVLALVRPIPPEVALEIAIQMCAGLDHAHNLEDVEGADELVHRDLKPSNVLLSRDGLVKVMDFGIAKATALSATNTATGTTKGTPSYMSPEQVEGGDLDARSDLFAVGAILFELFTGDRLFQADSLMSILMGVMQVEERLANSGVLDQLDLISLGLSDVVRKCLRKSPEDRYADAADLEHALKLVSRQLPPPPPMKQWVRGVMAGPGAHLGIGESSISTVPPQGTPSSVKPLTLRTGPAPSPQPPPPTVPRAAAPPVPPTRPQQRAVTGDVVGGAAPSAAAAVPPTRQQQPAPQAPPPTTNPNAMTGARPRTGTLWIDEDDAPRKKKGSPLLLLVLGLVLGGGLALLAAVAVVFLLPGDEPEPTVQVEVDPDPVLPDLVVAAEPDDKPGDGAAAVEATPRRTPRPRDPEPTPAAGSSNDPERTPERTSAVTPAPTPAVRAESTPKPTPRVRSTPRPTPAPNTREGSGGATEDPKGGDDKPVEETTARVRLRLTGVKGRVTGRDGEDIKVRFQASLIGQCDEPKVKVSFNPPGARWVTRELAHASGDLWIANVRFKPKNQGKVYYFMKATCAGGKSTHWGSESKPLKVEVK